MINAIRPSKIRKRGIRMNYIKAKFPNSTRSYTYRTEDSVKAGDTVVNANGAKLTVTDETVDMKWVETYGADKVAVVKKYEEPVDAGESEDK
nr:MAG TPA: hypothetical protein [Caudoviricetes sp.]